MSKKGVNIHKRKDGRWEGRYKVGVYENGTTKYASVYARTYAEVKEKLITKMACKAHFNEPTIKEKSFEEILQIWIINNSPKQKGSTEHKYRYMIERHIIPELGSLKMSQITTTTINLFLNSKLKSGRVDRKGGLAPSYVRTMALIIQSALRFAEEEGLCMPLKSAICKPTEEKKSLEILNKEEQVKLELIVFERIDTIKLGIMLSLYAGLRIGEVCALSWEDIDLEKNIIHVRHTISRIRNDTGAPRRTRLIIDTPKTSSSVRDIPISSVLLTYLFKMKKLDFSGFVLSGTSTFMSPRTYEYRFHKFLERCGIRQINYHMLRHTFATRCIEAGVDVKSLSEMLGHANVGITLNTYVHSSMDMKRQQLEKLGACAV